jgi:hypothetical protein
VSAAGRIRSAQTTGHYRKTCVDVSYQA